MMMSSAWSVSSVQAHGGKRAVTNHLDVVEAGLVLTSVAIRIQFCSRLNKLKFAVEVDSIALLFVQELSV
jgi:hypothetical protein